MDEGSNSPEGRRVLVLDYYIEFRFNIMERGVVVLLAVALCSWSVQGAPHRHLRQSDHGEGWVEPTPDNRAVAAEELEDFNSPDRDPNDGQAFDNCGTDDVDGDTLGKDDVEARIAAERIVSSHTYPTYPGVQAGM